MYWVRSVSPNPTHPAREQALWSSAHTIGELEIQGYALVNEAELVFELIAIIGADGKVLGK